ncbi:hypothetical protein Pmani_019028 [Petrolisthes manimaculis]|uniref:Uncharacterized protein n=1 Tax=Petrolisthes manimaculis TaxID=1843537 RepID=A0AAE1U3W8_9EUCA|nr:hypothetical protein Pmani_019028 [Petrolisthes manimaculis]
MLRVARPNTYKADMPPLRSEFYDFVGPKDKAAGDILAKHILNMVHRARKTKLVNLAQANAQSQANTHVNNNSPTITRPAQGTQGGTGYVQRLQKLVPGAKTDMPVFLPEDFISRVVRDIIRMSEGEPKGIRACILVLEVSEGRHRVTLGRIVCDPKVASTYTLKLRMVTAYPENVQSTFRFLGKGSDAIYFSPAYTIEKKRTITETSSRSKV